jgi:iron complex outermembrane receptor protein
MLTALPFAGVPAPLLALPDVAAPPTAAAAIPASSDPAEIIVTARRRTENLQDVPLAISVVGGARLESTGSFNVARLVQLQPSLQFISSNPRNSAINIRGLGAPFGLTNDGIEPGVGFYVDQVYQGRIAASTLDFVDVERIEVLRGPQGTLYGRNTTAGALNISTRKASFEPEARAEFSAGNLGHFQGKASVSGPIIADRLAARLSVSVTKRGGTLFNTVTGRDVNTLDNLGLRGHLLWRPTDRLELTLYADYNRQDPEGFAQNYAFVAPTARAANRQYANLAALSNYAPPSISFGDRLVDNDTPLRARQVLGGVSLVANWDLGPAILTSVSAWRTWDWQPSNDRDFTGLPITTVSANPSQQEQFSQELRLASAGDRTIEYTAGLFYFHQTINTQGVQQQGSAASLWLLGPVNGANPALLDGLRSDNDIRYRNDSFAVFGKLNWHLGDRLSVSPGLRVNHDAKDGAYLAIVSGGLSPVTPAQRALQNSVLQNQSYTARFSEWNVSGDVTLSYKPSDALLVYATYARSFKSGGINLSGLPTLADGVTPATTLATVRPEAVAHYEFGLKSQFWGRRATFNVAVFLSDISDYQATVVSGAVGVIRGYLANVPRVRSQGIEADLFVRPADTLDVYLNFAYTDAKYVSFPSAPPPLELSGGSVASVDASGGRLPGVSRHALSFGGEYRLPAQVLGRAGDWYLGLDGSYRSSFSSSPTPSRFQNVDAYIIANFRAGFRAANGWEVFGWVRNATGADYHDFLTAAPASTGLVVGQPGDPRTYGLTVKARF